MIPLDSRWSIIIVYSHWRGTYNDAYNSTNWLYYSTEFALRIESLV